MDTELRYGVIGTAMNGVEHIHNIRAREGCSVVALSDPVPQSRQAGVEVSGGVASAVERHVDLLNADMCDVVVIASPNQTHVEVLRDVLAVDGLHVLIEKPLCTTVADCNRVIEWSQGRSGLIWMGLEYRFMPPVSRLIDEVRDGAVGRPRCSGCVNTGSPFWTRWETGIDSPKTPSARWWRSAATSST